MSRTHSITVTCGQCEKEYDVEVEIDAGESNYGADADGNRGMYVGPSLVEPSESRCPHCYFDNNDQVVQAIADTDPMDLVDDMEPNLDDYDPPEHHYRGWND